MNRFLIALFLLFIQINQLFAFYCHFGNETIRKPENIIIRQCEANGSCNLNLYHRLNITLYTLNCAPNACPETGCAEKNKGLSCCCQSGKENFCAFNKKEIFPNIPGIVNTTRLLQDIESEEVYTYEFSIPKEQDVDGKEEAVDGVEKKAVGGEEKKTVGGVGNKTVGGEETENGGFKSVVLNLMFSILLFFFL